MGRSVAAELFDADAAEGDEVFAVFLARVFEEVGTKFRCAIDCVGHDVAISGQSRKFRVDKEEAAD
jgi:hypothetical protein